MCKLTKDGLDMLLEEIIDAVEASDDHREVQFNMVSTILIGNGIVEIID